jgi:hypothetical protein
MDECIDAKNNDIVLLIYQRLRVHLNDLMIQVILLTDLRIYGIS